VSGPVRTEDVDPDTLLAPADEPTLEITDSHEAQVGEIRVRRALPRRDRRTVGAWCFADHMGPVSVKAGEGVNIGPHPHIGLQTVTWLTAGEVLHRDSLGSEQPIRPGQLNLMTAGGGVSHAEEATDDYEGELQGIQLWVAQPETTRHGEPAFEHHAELPQVELDQSVATLLVGTFADASSPARRDTDHFGVDLQVRQGSTTLPVDPSHEHAIVVVDGRVELDGRTITPGHLAYVGVGREELALRVPSSARLLLLGGMPFESRVLMWWNFVARSRDEVDAAVAAWRDGDGRFGDPDSRLDRIPSPVPPWQR
jgi:redox-sensitive bicupin YhaK (pirin superfamily)